MWRIIHCTWCQEGWRPLSRPHFWTQQRGLRDKPGTDPHKSRNSSMAQNKVASDSKLVPRSMIPHAPQPKIKPGVLTRQASILPLDLSPAHGLRQALTLWPSLASKVCSFCFCLLKGSLYTCTTIFGVTHCSFEQQRGTQTHQG